MMDRGRAQLLLVDVQERLAPAVFAQEALVARCGALLSAARLFGIPVLATEHCPERIGPTVAALRDRLEAAEIFTKARFAATGHAEFLQRLDPARGLVVVAGMEAHVCVMQTALGLRAQGREVYVVEDAVGSRPARQADRRLALERLRDAGAVLLGTETALFEWCGGGDDPRWREVLALVKSLP